MIRLLLTECLSPHSSTHLDWLHTVFVKVIQQYSVAHKEKSEISLHKLKVLHHTLHFHKSMQAHPYCGMSRRGIFLKGGVGYPKRNGSINLTRYQQNISNVVDISSFSKGELCTVRKISYRSTEMCEKKHVWAFE